MEEADNDLRVQRTSSPLPNFLSSSISAIFNVLKWFWHPVDARVNLPSADGWTSLHRAVSNGHIQAAKALIDAGNIDLRLILLLLFHRSLTSCEQLGPALFINNPHPMITTLEGAHL